jgi:hypothetical protein
VPPPSPATAVQSAKVVLIRDDNIDGYISIIQPTQLKMLQTDAHITGHFKNLDKSRSNPAHCI